VWIKQGDPTVYSTQPPNGLGLSTLGGDDRATDVDTYGGGRSDRRVHDAGAGPDDLNAFLSADVGVVGIAPGLPVTDDERLLFTGPLRCARLT